MMQLLVNGDTKVMKLTCLRQLFWLGSKVMMMMVSKAWHIVFIDVISEMAG